ncbi:hypothetical protein GGI19_004543 [Coemansia pectinata]|uniref:Uncharacterized protein n=1 Tax=Coemansia pectinata TaxID=1052879 RepID=A0A9W8LAG8_9FUNG|nr:hypothetical protein GGI19_004543 [Coemansia pectinata]
MATIPTLIIAPAILAAGIAYKYTGGEGSDARNIGPATAMRRRRSETDTIGSRRMEGAYSTQTTGERFEQDFQPRVPTQRQLADSFIPTSILRGGPALQAQAADSSGDQGSRSLSSRMTLYGMSGGPAELEPDHTGRYPRTTDEIEHTSWLQRAARSITGDLGPIEHQERVVSMQHAGDSQHPAERADNAPRYFVRESVDTARDRSVQDAERAVDEARDWYWSKKKEIDDDINQAASDTLGATKQALDETQGWFWSKKKEVDDAAASAIDDVKQTASEVSESTKDAADKTREWFWSKKKEVDEDISQAYDETQGWFWAKRQEADDAVADVADSVKRQAGDVSDAARQSAREARDKLASKTQEAEEATAAAARDMKRRASDASDSAKQAADSTWGWLWSKKKQVDDTAANALDSAKDQAQSARDSVAAKSQQAKDAVGDAAETASDWVAAKKQGADDAVSNAADKARDSASNARDWVEDTKDDIANSVGRADDVSRAWLWNIKGQADQAIADTAGAVQQQAEAASNSAMESADAASRSYWQRGLGAGTNAGWRPSAETIIDTPRESSDESQKQRRDSLLSGIDDNSVIQALDEKFNEARSILRSTTDEIKTMASDASSAASETLRTAAEKTLPRPSNEGINMKEPDDGHRDMHNHSDAQARFVEVNSHIPLLSSSPHKRT